jgi:ribosomal protein RSM22 (predicted rRNA methylase)
MRLPEELKAAIEAETEAIPHRDLALAVAKLRDAYKQGSAGGSAIDSAAKLGAYLHVRMPATFAANRSVFQEIVSLVPGCEPHSLLDLGAGPGTAMWAAAEVFPSIESFTLVERDGKMLETGRRLAVSSRARAIRDAVWLQSDLGEDVAGDADLVVISYALGELVPQQRKAAIEVAWTRAKQMVIIIGPGTPADFQAVLEAREHLLQLGAHVLAPCPHECACPMADGSDWCHFSQRLERSSDHRRLKSGALGYEDEKFSYVIASRNPPVRAQARILRHPLKHSGHLQLRLCTDAGLQQITVTKSQKENYRDARKAEWGDSWSVNPNRE